MYWDQMDNLLAFDQMRDSDYIAALDAQQLHDLILQATGSPQKAKAMAEMRAMKRMAEGKSA